MRTPRNVAGDIPDHWHPASRVLHWVTVLLILLTVSIALYLVLNPELPESERGSTLWKLQFYLFNIHYLLGVTILGLVAIRLFLRWRHPSPTPDVRAPAWQRRAAGAVHSLLYANLVFMVVVGLIWIDAGGYHIKLNIFEWPVFPPMAEREIDLERLKLMKPMHYWGSICLAVLVTIHVSAALRHHFIVKDEVLRRMLGRRGCGDRTPSR